MHHNPKVNNLIALAEWFEAGAPEWHFDMGRGMSVRRHSNGDPITEECGTAGCIAGAAFAMAMNRMPKAARCHALSEVHIDRCDMEFSWRDVRDAALEFLGLEATEYTRNAHPLFGNEHTPPDCTTQDAAAAIRRVISGQEPWPAQAQA